MTRIGTWLAAALIAVRAAGAGAAEPSAVELPDTLVWTAYGTGSTGHSQAVAIGSVLQRAEKTRLRVIPAKNDVSRLSPLRAGRAHFSAGGSEAIYAQEAVFTFASRRWGPQPLRAVMWNISDGCSFTWATAKDADIREPADIEGKRLTWVLGAPSLNNAHRALLAYAGLTWDDVEKVEVGGYRASVDAVIENRADVVGGSCNSAPFRRIEASPRGLHFPPFPHDDEQAVARVRERLPWYIPHVATEGPTIPDSGIEVFTSPYPLLIAMAGQDEDLVYAMARTLHEHYQDYRDDAPGAEGWALERQQLEQAFVPYHPGAIRFYKEAGVWSEAAQKRHEANLARQRLLRRAWRDYTESDPPAAREAFMEGWMKARAEALEEAGRRVLLREW